MDRTRCVGMLLLGTLAGLACGGEDSNAPPSEVLTLATVVTGLDNPVYMTAAPGDHTRLFVVEQAGRIRIVKNGILLPDPFLDITDRTTRGDEQGLLGLAFDPAYATTGRFFVYYTTTGGGAAGHSVISRFSVSGDPDLSGTTEAIVLTTDQPFANHNGGMITFGPDGLLYAGLGDGGDGGDPLETGQDITDLLGSMLRLDVSGSSYTIPPDNPFVATAGARGEVWNYGLRNPWRFSFDRSTGDLYIGDVGQGQYEEVDLVAAGAGGGQNFGWDDLEGNHCFEDGNCATNPSVRPVLEYDHGSGRCAITGGYVYRGAAVPALVGHYFYADYCSRSLRSFRRTAGGSITDQMTWSGVTITGSPTSFGEDASGELYITTQAGRLLRFAAP